MLPKSLFTAIFLILAFTSQAQKKFIYSPGNPRPGDIITFTYEPGGIMANTHKPVEGLLFQVINVSKDWIIFQYGNPPVKVDDIIMTEKDGKYSGTIKTDSASNFIYFGFSADGSFDNNDNEGYYIHLYKNDKPSEQSYYNKSLFFQGWARRLDIDVNNEKSLAAIQKEVDLYPESKKTFLRDLIRLKTLLNENETLQIVQKAIEALLEAGLQDEADYTNLENLYTMAKLPEQKKLIESVKKEKIPNGIWKPLELVKLLYNEKDPDKKKTILSELIQKTADADDFRSKWDLYRSWIALAYAEKHDSVNCRKAIDEIKFQDGDAKAQLYKNMAVVFEQANTCFRFSAELSKFSLDYYKEQMNNPTGKKPDYLSQKQWTKYNRNMYAISAYIHAMALYHLGKYKQGMSYAKEAVGIRGKDDPGCNKAYALLAEKALSEKQYVKELEDYVKEAKEVPEIIDILKRAYIKANRSEAGYINYIEGLKNSWYTQMMQDLRKSMISKKAPAFTLTDLNGNKIDLNELKGKVVVADFWATWCGPCIASFPALQQIVDKYKDDQNVKFIFINSWEKGESKEKTVADFLSVKKYTFHVLMDNDGKVATDFKVPALPTKYIIDKNGFIRFISNDFDGNDEKLIKELTAIIEIVSNVK